MAWTELLDRAAIDVMIPDLPWYRTVREAVEEAGFGHEIEWAQTVGPPTDAEWFAGELIYVICNSGMRQQVARKIYDRIAVALHAGGSAAGVFRHEGKARSIDAIWSNRVDLFRQYGEAEDKLAWLAGVDWIGHITKYHAGKNFGLDLVKPDRHLERLATARHETPHDLCAGLAAISGDRIGTVDLVLWRAANLGILDTRSAPLAWPQSRPPAKPQPGLFDADQA